MWLRDPGTLPYNVELSLRFNSYLGSPDTARQKLYLGVLEEFKRTRPLKSFSLTFHLLNIWGGLGNDLELKGDSQLVQPLLI